MSDDLKQQIRSNFETQDSAELLELWRANDRAEYSGQSFEVIREILVDRGVELPEQAPARLTANDTERDREGRSKKPGAVYLVAVVAVIKAVGLLAVLLISATVAPRGALNVGNVAFIVVPAVLLFVLAWFTFRMKIGAFIAGIVYPVLQLVLVVYIFAEGRLYLDELMDAMIALNAVVDLGLIAIPCLVLLLSKRREQG